MMLTACVCALGNTEVQVDWRSFSPLSARIQIFLSHVAKRSQRWGWLSHTRMKCTVLNIIKKYKMIVLYSAHWSPATLEQLNVTWQFVFFFVEWIWIPLQFKETLIFIPVIFVIQLYCYLPRRHVLNLLLCFCVRISWCSRRCWGLKIQINP